METKKKNKSYFWLIFLVVLVIVIGGIWLVSFRESAQAPEVIETQKSAEEGTVDTSDWLTYENEEYGFSFKYPSDWVKIVVNEKDGPEGSKIIKSIKVTSGVDENDYIQVQVVGLKDKEHPSILDYPHSYIEDNNKYSFYFSGGSDCLGMPGCEEEKFLRTRNEIEQIVDTFKTKN